MDNQPPKGYERWTIALPCDANTGKYRAVIFQGEAPYAQEISEADYFTPADALDAAMEMRRRKLVEGRP